MTARLADTLRLDLAPSPDRLRGALEMTGLVVATAFISTVLHVPEAALSCYLIFFAWKDDAGSLIKESLLLLSAVSLALALMTGLLQLAADDQMLRLGLVMAFTIGGMFLSQATTLGPIGGTVGFVFAFGLTMPDVVPATELLSRALTWLWVVVAVPMLVMLAWGFLGARSCRSRIENRIRARELARAAPQGRAAMSLLDEGLARDDALLAFARAGDLRADEEADLARRSDDSYFQLALAEAGAALTPSTGATPPEKAPFFKPGAFATARHIQFALKVALAVAITYGFYTAFGGFEIHTAMITCFYVSLGTRGETHRKSLLRLIGCLLGAAAGVIAVTFVMPHISDIGQLMILLAVVIFPAAWLSTGSERVSYAGWQMALCFLLVVLHGTGPTTSFAAASDRIWGVLIGICVIWLVSAAIWPVSADDDARAALTALDARLHGDRPHNGRSVALLRAPLAEARMLVEVAALEQGASDLGEAVARADRRYREFVKSGSTDA